MNDLDLDLSRILTQLIRILSLYQIIADAVRTTLGPRGMDKLIVNAKGEATI